MISPLESLGGGGTSNLLGNQGEDENDQIKKGAKIAGVSASDAIPIKVADQSNSSSPAGVTAQPQQAAPTPATAPTFQQLRDAGRARPAPAATAPIQLAPRPVVGSNTNPQVGATRDQILSSVQQLLAKPTGYGSDQMQDTLKRFTDTLDAQAVDGRRGVNESLASRGFYDGSEAARNLGQYEASLDRQKRDYAGNLADAAAQRDASERSNAIQTANSTLGSINSQDLANAQLQENQRQFEGNFEQAGQDQALRREQVLRSLGLDEEKLDATISQQEKQDLFDLLDKLGSGRISGGE